MRNRQGITEIMTNNTTPISIYNTVISGAGVHVHAGMASYAPTSNPNLTVFAVPATELTTDQVYSITGLVVGTNKSVSFPQAMYLGPLDGAPTIATFKTNGWQSV
jgi:hypothetical protein